MRLKNQLSPPAVSHSSRKIAHLKYWVDLTQKYNLTNINTDACSERIWDKSYIINLDSLKGGLKHIQHSEYTIYTDDSKKREGTGCGFVLYHRKTKIHTQSFSMHDHATVYQAELEAIKQACIYMDEKHNELKPKYVKILTDSQTALKTLNNIDFNSTIALETAEALENLSWRTKACTVSWIKAHAGTEGNEAADAAAKEGTECDITQETLNTKIPYKTIRNNIEEAVYSEWEKTWQTSTQYKHTKNSTRNQMPTKQKVC